MKTLPVVCALFVCAEAASAATLSYSASVAETSTDWSRTLQLQQFDSSLGTLTSATLHLSGTVNGAARTESLDNAARSVTLDLSALIEATVFGQSAAAVDVLPADRFVFDAAAYDGTIDFDGTSGISLDSLTDTDADSTTYTGNGLTPFIGTGLFDVSLFATGTSSATGAGNLITHFTTEALASVTVEYTYAAVPLPASLPLMLAAGGGLAMLRRRR